MVPHRIRKLLRRLAGHRWIGRHLPGLLTSIPLRTSAGLTAGTAGSGIGPATGKLLAALKRELGQLKGGEPAGLKTEFHGAP